MELNKVREYFYEEYKEQANAFPIWWGIIKYEDYVNKGNNPEDLFFIDDSGEIPDYLIIATSVPYELDEESEDLEEIRFLYYHNIHGQIFPIYVNECGCIHPFEDYNIEDCLCYGPLLQDGQYWKAKDWIKKELGLDTCEGLQVEEVPFLPEENKIYRND